MENRQEYLKKWQAENTVKFSVRLQKSTDADLIEWLDGKPSTAGEVKRLMRIAIGLLKNKEDMDQ